MARIYRQHVTRYHTPDGRRCKAGTPGAVKKVTRTRKWYGEWRGAGGKLCREPLSTDKGVALQLLAQRTRAVELGRVGIADPHAAHRDTPVLEHLAAWERDLRASGTGEPQVRQAVARARKVVQGCRFATAADLSASAVNQWLAGLRVQPRRLVELPPGQESFAKAELAEALGIQPNAVKELVRRHQLAAAGNGKARRYPRATAEALAGRAGRGRSAQTSNGYLAAAKAFAAWLVRDKRAAENPLAHMEAMPTDADRRHDRRALSREELSRLLGVTAASTRTWRGLGGPDRARLYLTAAVTGYRSDELAALTTASFDLEAEPPTATVGAGYTKNTRLSVQPLPAELVAVLRPWLAGKPPHLPLWPGTWHERAADMLKPDLRAAGIPYTVPGPDGPLYADFHCLRHTYGAYLEASGASLKEAMALMRHSDPRLTLKVYGKADLAKLGRAAARLPEVAGGLGKVLEGEP